MSAPGPGNGEDRLDSWKEIATHFGTTERTVQRREETEGSPVHRRLHRTKQSVHAYRAELDQWWASRLTKEESKPEVERLESSVKPVRPASSQRRYWILGGLTTVLSGLFFAV